MSSVSLIHSVSDSNPRDWHYLSEGGATLVLSYRGPPDKRFNGMVLRLKKISITKPNNYSDEVEDPGMASIESQNRIISRLILDRYLPRLFLVGTDPVWLLQLTDLVQPSRPLLRQQKDIIDTRQDQAVLATDLTASDSWLVEIKPKWGFLPSGTHLSPDTRPYKTRTCRYCMHSYLKSLKGEAAADGFCPLDLYSGIRERVEIALGTLWDQWIGKAGHINNLKIFVKGQILPANNPSSLEDLRRTFVESSSYAGSSESSELREGFIAQLTPVILSSDVLATLSELQRKLDPLDIEGLSSLWARHRNTTGDGTDRSLPTDPEPTMNDYTICLDHYLMSGKEVNHDHPKTEDLWYYTVTQLLSGTFKDCSIIVRPTLFRHERSGEPGCSAEAITIIDLDRKPIRKLQHWARLDKEIISAYRNSGLDKICVDARARSP